MVILCVKRVSIFESDEYYLGRCIATKYRLLVTNTGIRPQSRRGLSGRVHPTPDNAVRDYSKIQEESNDERMVEVTVHYVKESERRVKDQCDGSDEGKGLLGLLLSNCSGIEAASSKQTKSKLPRQSNAEKAKLVDEYD